MLVTIKRTASYALSAEATADTITAIRDALDNKRRGVRALLPFAGPAVIASVGYMDPGNFATNIQAGSTTQESLQEMMTIYACKATRISQNCIYDGETTSLNLVRRQAGRPAG